MPSKIEPIADPATKPLIEPQTEPISERDFELKNLKVHALTCGSPSAEPVVLLHGFPELSESWRDILPQVAAAGFYAVAPDLRGYGRTERPRHGYDIDTLSTDVTQLFDALGVTSAHLVGHDWGGAIAYHVAQHRPERVKTLTVVNCPPAQVLANRIWSPDQLGRSWYIFFFQLPWLPELWLTRDRARRVRRMMKGAAVDQRHFTDEKLEVYQRNFVQPGAATAAVNYYRQMVRRTLNPRKLRERFSAPKIRAPFRLIWGEQDRALGKELTVGLDPYFERRPDIRYLPGVGHFATIEAPEKVGALIVDHLLHPAAQE